MKVKLVHHWTLFQTNKSVKTCFKSVKGSCIDLNLTSRPSSHQFTNVFETGFSDHHLLIYTMLKSTYTKMEQKVLSKVVLELFRTIISATFKTRITLHCGAVVQWLSLLYNLMQQILYSGSAQVQIQLAALLLLLLTLFNVEIKILAIIQKYLINID